MSVYHVAKNGCDYDNGTEDHPFLTISKAAAEAVAGDTVLVHEGVYREWVRPANSGEKLSRITYKTADGEKAVIKGSERITSWVNDGGDVWKVELPESFFPYGNPYSTPVFGDWLQFPVDYTVHTGEVYLNGKSFYEAPSLDEVRKPVVRDWPFLPSPHHTKVEQHIRDLAGTLFTWFCSVEEGKTTIWANFQGADPNEECVEINVRPAVFYPEKTGVNYVTVSGFELCQAATNWAPPTADQRGLIGPHWAKGWIIEDCDIHDSKCSAVSLGKDGSTGDNECSKSHRKAGYHYQEQVVFRALDAGWSKDNVGSHIVRRNRIHDNGQNGIVGHLGCVFSEIHDNEIWNVGIKHEFVGAEIAGVKLHAALDVQMHDNYIHDTILGTWLDWQTQGTRLSRNLYLANDRDIYVEVSHGPYIFDSNIFGSEYNFENFSQGGALVNNLFCGKSLKQAVLNRSTPFHFAHSTKVAGTSFIYSADDRVYQNIYIGGAPVKREGAEDGTASYDGCPSSMAEYKQRITDGGVGDLILFLSIKQPAYIGRNVYYNGAKSYDKESEPLVLERNPSAAFSYEDGKVYLEFDADDELLSKRTEIVRSWDFEPTRISDCPFESPEGEDILFDTDYNGGKRGPESPAGPFAKLSLGKNRIKIWG